MARARASRFVIFLWARIVSTICSSTVRTGLRLVIGSWKIIAMSRPADVAHVLLAEPDEVRAVEHDLCRPRSGRPAWAAAA